ncbi:MAG: protein kinase [candidate division KSB1 bacterium]|nr:protein kinase [candidate division KSB1 bacterium]
MLISKVIDEKYEILREIKRGGFGVIYEGLDLATDRKVAIKAVDPRLLGEAKYIDMFRDEALSVARLNHHNIVQIFDIRRDEDGQFYIIMEFIDGPDLSRLIRAGKRTGQPLPLHLGVYIVAEVCAGLDYAHNRKDPQTNQSLNLVHQDISPANIMVTRNGEVKIIDFGIANFRRKQSRQKGQVLIQGKLNYIAPEQLNGSTHLDRRADIFSLGLVLYELLTGKRLIRASDPQTVVDILRHGKWNLSGLQERQVPENLQQIVRKALAVKPDNRYANANQMYMELMHFLILTAPAADFSTELAEYIQKVQDEMTTEAEDAASTTDKIPPDGLSQQPPADDVATVPADEPAEKAAPQAKDPRPENGKQSDLTSELMDISELTVEEIEKAHPVEPDGPSADGAADSKPADGAEPVTDVEFGPEMAATDAEPEPETASAGTKAPPITDIPPHEVAPEAVAEEPSAPPKSKSKTKKKARASEEAEPQVKILDSQNDVLPETPSKFYSIVEEIDDEEEELKTIIDVVRLSARSHQKSIKVGLFSLAAMFVLFTVVDTFAHFTALGTSIYDFLFPPAIKIVSIPPGAQVYLDDKPLQETTPLSIEEISPGVHKLMLTMSRFEPIIKSIHVPRKGELQVAGEKKRHPSQPYVFRFRTQLELSSYPSGATIYINDIKLAETTPTTVFWEVTDEPIRIKMTYAGLPDITGLEIDGLRGQENISDRRFWKFQRLDRVKDHFAIEGVFRKPVEIKSIPGRAEIYLDDADRPVGITGINGTLLLTVGQHLITLRKNGYLPRQFSIEVNENTPSSLTHLLLRRVRIFAKEEGATEDSDIGARIVELRTRRQRINLDETTPAEIRLLPYRYTAVLKKPGFQDFYLQIAPGQRMVMAKMQRLPARIALIILDRRTREPLPNASVYYRNLRTLGEESQLGVSDENGSVISEIKAGRYQIRVEKPGYRPKSKILNFRSDALNRYTFQMETQE